MDYPEAVSYLESLVDFERMGFRRHFADTVNLDSLWALLDLLGNPQQGLPCVHIAGTKGKGSVAALTESIVRAAGYHTGLFTSPHFVSFRERIRLDGAMATEAEIVRAAAAVQGPIEQLRAEGKLNPSTFFEAYCAMAYVLFRQYQSAGPSSPQTPGGATPRNCLSSGKRGVDLAVMETGLGGRLDATNTCEPRACAITTLGLDHTEILGETLAQIAREKAGILKAGVPAVFAPQAAEVEAVLRDVAAAVGAPLSPAPAVLQVRPAPRLPVPAAGAPAAALRPQQQVTVALGEGPLTLGLPLPGLHQAGNLAVSLGLIQLLREQGCSLPEEAVRQGVQAVRWPGRLQVASARPWLVLDAAHNEAAAQALAAALPGLVEYDRLIAVLGLSAEKDAEAFCRTLAPLVDVAVLTQAGISRALPAEDLARASAGLWRESLVVPEVGAALAAARQRAGARDCILVTGSFYVVGEVMAREGLEG